MVGLYNFCSTVSVLLGEYLTLYLCAVAAATSSYFLCVCVFAILLLDTLELQVFQEDKDIRVVLDELLVVIRVVTGVRFGIVEWCHVFMILCAGSRR